MLDFDFDLPDIPQHFGIDFIDDRLNPRKQRLNTPILALDGSALPLKNCRISPGLEIKEQDMSGQTSATAHAEQGTKGQELNVSGFISFDDHATLSRVFELARATDCKGKRKVYVIGCDIAKALNIRQVRFAGRVTAPEQENLRAWQVSFRLREHLSPSERTEKQKLKQQQEEKPGETTDAAGPQQPTLKGLVDSYNQLDENTLLETLSQQIEEALK